MVHVPWKSLNSEAAEAAGFRRMNHRPADDGLLLLARDRLGLALAGARIGVRALAADRQALAMAKPAIAGEIHQPLDVHRGGPAKITLNRVIGVDRLTNLKHFGVRQILHPAFGGDLQLARDFPGLGAPNAVDVGQRNLDALVGGDVDPGNTCHMNKFSQAPQGGVARAPHLKAMITHPLAANAKPTDARMRRRVTGGTG